MAQPFPVYDICSIDDRSGRNGLMIGRFGLYLKKHYQRLHLAHRHSFYHLVIFTKGTGSHTIDFETFPVRPFQIYFMIPGQVHSWHFKEEVDGYIVHFDESLFTSFLQNPHYLERFGFFDGNSEDCVCQLPTECQTPIIQLFESMLREIEEDRDKHLDIVRIRLLELFIIVERACSGKKRKNIPPQKLLLLQNFKHLIDKQFRRIKLPKEYAELLYITPNHLNALCQDLLGKTAGDVIRDRVLLEAKRLLTNANMTIAEIAYDLNFQDNSYFTRFFKKYTGVTPEEFRKKIQSQNI
jgi:AraC-like DNA-binding protein